MTGSILADIAIVGYLAIAGFCVVGFTENYEPVDGDGVFEALICVGFILLLSLFWLPLIIWLVARKVTSR